MLNISARNCKLKVSEILVMRLFLKMEKSSEVMPGPIRILRPALPRRLKHLRSPAGSGPPKVGGAGSQFCVQKAISGAVGTAKHPVLTYLLALPGFVRLLQPAPPSRFRKAQSSELSVPVGSSPVPHVGVNGTPSLAVKITPSCQPSLSQCAGPLKDLGDGTSQVPFRTSVRPMLKSERARLNFGSNANCRLEIEFPNASPATVAELVSMLLPQVKVPCIWKPWLMRLATCVSSAL